MTSSKIPENCETCHDREWCDNLYRGIGCNYQEDIDKEDVVREPSHYKHGAFETIDEMIIAFGPGKTYDYCIMNAWKYRARAPFKGNPGQDMNKANMYLELANEILKKNPNFFGSNICLIKED